MAYQSSNSTSKVPDNGSVLRTGGNLTLGRISGAAKVLPQNNYYNYRGNRGDYRMTGQAMSGYMRKDVGR